MQDFALGRRVRQLWQRDDGIAMPMVLMVFLVGVALIGAFMVAVIGASKVSSGTQENVQAQAAADAGISAAVAALTGPTYAATSFCTSPAQTVTGTNPNYTVSITCDSITQPTSVTLLSRGTGANGSFANVQAVFPVTPASGGGSDPIDTLGFYLGGQNRQAPLNQITFRSTTNPAPSFVIIGRDFVCGGANGIDIPGDVFLWNGDFSTASGCKVAGTVYAGADASSNKGNVKDTNTGGVMLNGVQATGNVDLYHSVGTASKPGDVYAGKNLTTANMFFQIGNAYVEGSVTLGSNQFSLFTSNGAVKAKGSISGPGVRPAIQSQLFPNSTAVPINSVPPADKLPAWIEYDFRQSDWSAAGYQTVTWARNSNGCKNPAAELQALGAQRAPFTKNVGGTNVTFTGTVVDAMACGALSLRGGTAFSLASNLSVITTGATFQWSGTTVAGSGTGVKQFSIITPDAVMGNGKVDCPQGGSDITLQGVTGAASAKLSIYSSCGVNIMASSFTGGLFMNGIQSGSGDSTITLAPLTLPGASFSQTVPGSGSGGGGSTVPTLTGGAAAAPSTIRNVG